MCALVSVMFQKEIGGLSQSPMNGLDQFRRHYRTGTRGEPGEE